MVKDPSKIVHAHEQVGYPLRDARVASGLEVEDVAKQLNIPPRQIRALEEGDFSVFAAEVYARGAYVKYATYLGMNAEQAHRTALRALSGVRQPMQLRMHTPQQWYERLVTPKLMVVGISSCLALLVAGYIGWQVRTFWQLPALDLTSPTKTYLEDEVITIRGVSEPNARVRINGESVLLKGDASFEVEMTLHPGINVVYAEAENAAGRIRVIEQHLLHPRENALL